MTIPTVGIEWDEECYPPVCRVINTASGKCIATFDDEDDAAAWAIEQGYDIEYSPSGIEIE